MADMEHWRLASATRRRALQAIAAVPFHAAVFAQGERRVRRIGYLTLGTIDSSRATQELLRQSLSKLGLREGDNLSIDWKFAQGDVAKLPALAAELVASNVELIVAAFSQAIVAAHAATRTIPIVMLGALAPVEMGLVASLSRPGGNLTGTNYFSPEMTGKILGILAEVTPAPRRVAVLRNPDTPGVERYKPVYDHAARTLGLQLVYFDVRTSDQIAPALAAIAASHSQALYITGDSVINPSIREIAGFALRQRMVSIGTALVHVRDGALMYYGPDFPMMVERVAVFTRRILSGAAPADLPVEDPVKFELVVNQKTARALSLELPRSIIVATDRFIE